LSSNPEPLTSVPTVDLHLLHPVLTRALAKEPAERYQSAREMHEHLRRIQERLSVTIAGPIASQAPRELPPSIAILPFSDLSSERDQEYFCAGLSEELISSLTRLQGLRVASRTSAFQYKDRAVDVRTIGSELNVRTVLEGSVRKAGNRLRITVQLTDVQAGYSLWSGRYDREMQDIFAIQEEIAESIADTLRKTFDIPLEGVAIQRQTANLEAYHAYLRGRYFWNKRTEEDLRRGIRLFREAIEKDPRFALAHAGLADSYVLLGIYGAAPPGEVMPEAREAAARALELDKTLAEAHTSLACVAAIYDWDWPAAEESFQRAIRLAPGYATARQWYAINCLTPLMRFEEAAAELQTALELDPLSLPVSTSLAIQLFYAREHAAAAEQCRRVLEVDPDFPLARFFLGLCYAEEGRPQEAVQELLAATRDRRAEMLAGLGYTYGRYGAKQEARIILEELVERSRQRYISPALIAQVQVGLGDLESALEWLGRAFEAHATELAWLRVRPFFERLHGEPAFDELLDRLGLPA
ncbi:MAG: tetratricopeptide repeat protein, partial [Thermoanaerobaculia bacterium]